MTLSVCLGTVCGRMRTIVLVRVRSMISGLGLGRHYLVLGYVVNCLRTAYSSVAM